MKTVDRFSPSTLEHLAICPGWVSEIFGDKKAADEGKLLHKALETGNLAGLNEEQTLCVTKIRIAFAQGIRRLGRGPQIWREEWVGIEDFNRGIVDLLAVAGKKALVADAKFGRREVTDAEYNLQGISYVIAIFERFSEVEEIELLFAQPRCNMLSTALFHREVYHSLLLRLKQTRANVEKFRDTQNYEMLHPEENNCAYCGNLADCPAVGSKAVALAQGYDLAHDKELPDLFQPAQLATPERRAQAERLRRVLERWCSSVQKHNVEHRLNGEEIPGYELAHRKGERSITSPIAAWEVAQKITDGQLTEEDLAACSKISASKLDEVVASRFPRGKKAAAKLKLEEALVDRDAISLGAETHYLTKIK